MVVIPQSSLCQINYSLPYVFWQQPTLVENVQLSYKLRLSSFVEKDYRKGMKSTTTYWSKGSQKRSHCWQVYYLIFCHFFLHLTLLFCFLDYSTYLLKIPFLELVTLSYSDLLDRLMHYDINRRPWQNRDRSEIYTTYLNSTDDLQPDKIPRLRQSNRPVARGFLEE